MKWKITAALLAAAAIFTAMVGHYTGAVYAHLTHDELFAETLAGLTTTLLFVLAILGIVHWHTLPRSK